jgi:Phage integrase family
VTTHVLRHMFGTELTRSGVDLVTAAELMGHASLETTRLYTRPSDARSPPCHADPVEWHWGNIGSMLAGLAALLVAVVTLPQIPSGVRDWREWEALEAGIDGMGIPRSALR